MSRAGRSLRAPVAAHAAWALTGRSYAALNEPTPGASLPAGGLAAVPSSNDAICSVGRVAAEIAEPRLLPPLTAQRVEQPHIERRADRAVERQSKRIILVIECHGCQL
jgi:hypothetical protein